MRQLVSGRASADHHFSASEFADHSNHRIVAAFFSGIVLWSSLYYLLRSPLTWYIKQRIIYWVSIAGIRLRSSPLGLPVSDPEAQKRSKGASALKQTANAIPSTDSIFRRQDNPTLIFAMSLLFFMASISQFVSTLVFTFDERSRGRNEAYCAFIVAWDSMALQSARLIGLIVLGFNLNSLGVKRRESIFYGTFIAIIAALIIVGCTLQFGFVDFPTFFSQDDTTKLIAFCNRKHVLASSLVLSLISMGLEVYCIFRLLDIIAPPSFPVHRRLDALFRNIRIVRALSLLLFDLIIIAPNGVETSYLGDYLPFSLSALIILVTFNDYCPEPPLFHRVAARTGDNISTTNSGDVMTYKALVVSPHPYSAMALSAGSYYEQRSGLSTASGSQVRLLKQGITSSTSTSSSDRNKALPRRPILPPVPVKKPPLPDSRVRPRSKSRSRTGSSRTRVSNRSQIPRAVRHIVPKEELARQFSARERAVDPNIAQILNPRPRGQSPKKSNSASPIQSPPPATLRSNDSRLSRYSGGESMVHTVGSASVRYGSDILRPEPGRRVRDKMRASVPSTRAETPHSMATHGTCLSESDVTVLKRQHSHARSSYDTWVSDSTVDAYTSPRPAPAPPTPSVPILSEGWPAPPSYTLRPTDPITPNHSLTGSEASATSTQAVVGVGRRTRPVRGPVMQFPVRPRSNIRTKRY